MGKVIRVMGPRVERDHSYIVDCAVDQFAAELLDSAGTQTPRGGVVAMGCSSFVVWRGGTRIGATSMVVVKDTLALEALYLEPGWRKQGLLEPTLLDLQRLAQERGLRAVYLRAPVHPALAAVGDRLGMEIGEEPEGYHPERASIEKGNRWTLAQVRKHCRHAGPPCPSCGGAWYRRQLVDQGMYAAMLNHWAVGTGRSA